MVELRRSRETRGVTQDELASRLGLRDGKAVRSLERPGSNPTLRSILRYADALNISLDLEVEDMHVLTIFNHAGGVGKTSTVRDLGYTLASSGLNVLLIDADPQANLTNWLGHDDDVDLKQTLHPAVTGKIGTRHLPKPLHLHGLDLIPSCLDLAEVESQLLGKIDGLLRLRNAVADLTGYDFVLIDPPPNLGQISAMCAIASDQLLVPLPTNTKGFGGVKNVHNMLAEYQAVNSGLKVAMYLVTQYDSRNNHDREALSVIKERFGSETPVSPPLTYRPAVYKDAQVTGKPVAAYKPGSPASEEIEQVTDALLETLGVTVAA